MPASNSPTSLGVAPFKTQVHTYDPTNTAPSRTGMPTISAANRTTASALRLRARRLSNAISLRYASCATVYSLDRDAAEASPEEAGLLTRSPAGSPRPDWRPGCSTAGGCFCAYPSCGAPCPSRGASCSEASPAARSRGAPSRRPSRLAATCRRRGCSGTAGRAR